MVAHSKYQYSEEGKDWKDGGHSAGDFHVWVKRKCDGKIIDPHISPEYDILISKNDLNVKKPVHKEWKNQEKHVKNIFALPWFLTEEGKATPNTNIPLLLEEYYHNGPKYQCCPQNSIAWLHSTPERMKNYKLVVGSMGWKNRNSPGTWYEWG